MSKEIDISIDNAFRQASMTAHDYLNQAFVILKEMEVEHTTADAIALAHIMSIDFNATMRHMKTQEIRDAIREGKV